MIPIEDLARCCVCSIHHDNNFVVHASVDVTDPRLIGGKRTADLEIGFH